MQPLHRHTPALHSPLLSDRCGADVYLKLDLLQPTGSFKIRGIGHACQARKADGTRRIVSSSGGNAGIAAAHAGRRLSLPVDVFVPETTTSRAIALIEREGAAVTVAGASWQEANEAALAQVDDASTLIHPFDDPLLWTGHASIIDELLADQIIPDALVLSVGGGGLLCGVAEGLERHHLQTELIAVETEGAASLSAAIEAGAPTALPAIDSVATSLGARRVCDQAFEVTRTHSLRSIVVDDGAALDATFAFLDAHQLLVEPACGAALAPLFTGLVDGSSFDTIVVEVCGGVTTDLTTLLNLRETLSRRLDG